MEGNIASGKSTLLAQLALNPSVEVSKERERERQREREREGEREGGREGGTERGRDRDGNNIKCHRTLLTGIYNQLISILHIITQEMN